MTWVQFILSAAAAVAALPVLFFFAVLAVFVLSALASLVVTPGAFSAIFADLRAIRERDPAAEGWIACVLYPGWWALNFHRLAAHPLYKMKLRTPARMFNFLARFLTGADIHPGAKFGSGIFIDHAHGVVIGETAIVGNNVSMLHQVTLGGTGKESGKRHPTIQEGVLLGVGAKILGNIVIGSNSKVGAGSVVVHAVPPNSTVVGIPGKVVGSGGQRVPAQQLDQTSLPDPLIERIRQQVHDEIKRIEKTLRKDDEAKKAPVAARSASFLRIGGRAGADRGRQSYDEVEERKRWRGRSMFCGRCRRGARTCAISRRLWRRRACR